MWPTAYDLFDLADIATGNNPVNCKRATIGPLAKRHSIGPLAKRHSNGVSLAGRWWPDIECCLGGLSKQEMGLKTIFPRS